MPLCGEDRTRSRNPNLVANLALIRSALLHLCQTQSYLRIGQRYLRMTQNPL